MPNPSVERLDQVHSTVWERLLDRSPYLRVQKGVAVTRIPAGTPTEIAEDAAFAAHQLTALAGISETELDNQRAVTAGVLRSLLEEQVRAEHDHWFSFPVAPYSTAQLSLYVDQLLVPYSFSDRDDVERYLQLLRDYAGVVRELSAKLTEQDRRGIRLPAPALPGAVAAITGHRAAADAKLRLGNRQADTVDHGAVAQADRLVDDEVLPAFDDVLALLHGPYRDQLPESVGMSQYPGGAEAYQRAVRGHTTLPLTPEEVHRIGVEQVARLTAEMADARAALGFDGDEEDFRRHLDSLPQLFAQNTAELERRYTDYMDRLEPLLQSYFRTLPAAQYGVARMDPALEAGMTYGYYEPPTPDRPIGRYRYNASNLEKRSLLTAAALIYHELAPGHHFHVARQREDGSLPEIRRELFGFSAFTEGWAEYASNLAREMGLLDDYDIYGRLIHERFTAQRLVIDTGMNALGWSLERARQYMRANTIESDAQVASETLRYATDLPGQALAYRIGFLEITAIRDRAQQRLGKDFDVRDFHEAVVGAGAMPLDTLDAHVARELAASPV